MSISEVIQRQGHTVTGGMILTCETVAQPLSPWTGVRLKLGLHGGRPETDLPIPIDPYKSSDHYIYHQFNIQQIYVLPAHVFMCFVWISEQTAIIYLYRIN